MKKVDIKKIAGASTLSLGLVLGIAGYAGAQSGMIDTTGPNSENEISHEVRTDIDYRNDNDIDLENTTEQEASSGDAEVTSNTTGGSAMTGSAMNDSNVAATIMVQNTAPAMGGGTGGAQSFDGSIENTGPSSDNTVTYEVATDIQVNNDNNIDINNDVNQSATSGSATVSGNTTGGNAVSGNVSNTSSSSFTVHVAN